MCEAFFSALSFEKLLALDGCLYSVDTPVTFAQAAIFLLSSSSLESKRESQITKRSINNTQEEVSVAFGIVARARVGQERMMLMIEMTMVTLTKRTMRMWMPCSS